MPTSSTAPVADVDATDREATHLDAVATGLVADLEAAWNAADGAAFGDRFATDADFVDIRGVHHRGRAAIATGHQGILDSIYRASTLSYRVTSVRPITATTAVVHVDATLDAPTGPMAGTNRSRASLVLARHDDRWEVASFHNTLRREA